MDDRNEARRQRGTGSDASQPGSALPTALDGSSMDHLVEETFDELELPHATKKPLQEVVTAVGRSNIAELSCCEMTFRSGSYSA